MANTKWHSRSFVNSLEHFKDAEKDCSKAIREGACLAAHTAWSQMEYYYGNLEAELDSVDESDLMFDPENALSLAKRTLDSLRKKFDSCVKAI